MSMKWMLRAPAAAARACSAAKRMFMAGAPGREPASKARCRSGTLSRATAAARTASAGSIQSHSPPLQSATRSTGPPPWRSAAAFRFAPAEARQERERETESLRDENVGGFQRGAQIARNAEGLLPERLRAFGDERDLVARGEATRELHRPDAGAGHLRPHHVLAVPDHLHRV